MLQFDDLAYGTGKHRHAPAHRAHRDDSDDITDLGKMAVKGIVTVGAVGITANLVAGALGSFPPVE